MAIEHLTLVDGFVEWAAGLPGSDYRIEIWPDGSVKVVRWAENPRSHETERFVDLNFEDVAAASDYFTDQDFGDLVALDADCACDGDDLEVTITAGDGPYTITALLDDVAIEPLSVAAGTHVLTGPGIFTDVTVTETSGDSETEVVSASIECPE